MSSPRRALGAAALALALLAGAAGAQSKADLCILHFNDFHGQILPRQVVERPGKPPVPRGGYAAMVRRIAERRAEYGDRLWVTNGGDWFQGTPEGNEDRGVSVMAALDRLQLTASVLGNHEYDFGERHLIQLLQGVAHPVLGANVRDADATALRGYVRPYLVRTVRPRAGGTARRIALVGLITRDTPRVSTGPFGRAVFADEVETLTALWPALAHDADIVVLLTHCGLDRDRELARRFPDIALILGGHSHTALQRPVQEGTTTIVQSGSGARALTELGLQLTEDGLRVVDFAFRALEPAAPDRATAAFLLERFGALHARWDVPLGEVRGAPDRRGSAGSTPGGNYIADLIRAVGNADVGLTNKGGLRTTLAAGPITRRQVFEFVPFDNAIVTVELLGQQLRDALQESLAPGRRPLEISGARFGYRVVDGQRELTEVRVGDQPLDTAKRYRVATNSFLAGGGDGQHTLGKAPAVEQTDRFLRDFVVEALQARGFITLPADIRIRFSE